jgi:hypothetical protein
MTEVKYTMNLSPEVHRQMKITAIERGLSLKDYLLDLFYRDRERREEKVGESYDKMSKKYSKTLRSLSRR